MSKRGAQAHGTPDRRGGKVSRSEEKDDDEDSKSTSTSEEERKRLRARRARKKSEKEQIAKDAFGAAPGPAVPAFPTFGAAASGEPPKGQAQEPAPATAAAAAAAEPRGRHTERRHRRRRSRSRSQTHSPEDTDNDETEKTMKEKLRFLAEDHSRTRALALAELYIMEEEERKEYTKKLVAVGLTIPRFRTRGGAIAWAELAATQTQEALNAHMQQARPAVKAVEYMAHGQVSRSPVVRCRTAVEAQRLFSALRDRPMELTLPEDPGNQDDAMRDTSAEERFPFTVRQTPRFIPISGPLQRMREQVLRASLSLLGRGGMEADVRPQWNTGALIDNNDEKVVLIRFRDSTMQCHVCARKKLATELQRGLENKMEEFTQQATIYAKFPWKVMVLPMAAEQINNEAEEEQEARKGKSKGSKGKSKTKNKQKNNDWSGFKGSGGGGRGTNNVKGGSGGAAKSKGNGTDNVKGGSGGAAANTKGNGTDNVKGGSGGPAANTKGTGTDNGKGGEAPAGATAGGAQAENTKGRDEGGGAPSEPPPGSTVPWPTPAQHAAALAATAVEAATAATTAVAAAAAAAGGADGAQGK
jgi:hypothetical protein